MLKNFPSAKKLNRKNSVGDGEWCWASWRCFAPTTLFNMLPSSSGWKFPHVRFDWKLFSSFSRCYRFSIRWFWYAVRGGRERRSKRDGGWQKIYFCIKNSNRIRLLHSFYTTFFLCVENFEGKFITVWVYGWAREATWIHEFILMVQSVSRNYSDDNFQGCRISFAHNLKKEQKILWMKEFLSFLFLVRGNASFLC